MEDLFDNNTSLNSTTNSNGPVKYCPECGKQLPESAAFCPFCGYSFQDIQNNVTEKMEPTMPLHDPNSKVYPKDLGRAGHIETKSWDYDPYQGNPYNAPADPIPPQTNNKIVIIVAAIAAAVIAAAVGFLVIAPAIMTRVSEDTTSQVSEASTTQEETQTAGKSDNNDNSPSESTKPPTQIPTATPTPTPTPTLTPTPTPTPTPMEQLISPIGVIDSSTGQPISIPNDTATSYAYPDSSTRVWTYNDVNGMTAGQVRYCINEIYARNGYTFAKPEWLNYFSQKTWYTPRIPAKSFNDSYLTSTEVANVNLLQKYYEDRKFPPY